MRVSLDGPDARTVFLSSAGGFKSIATGELVKFDVRAIDGTPRRLRSMISTASGLPKTIATHERINLIDIGGTNESAGGDRSL